MADMPVVLSEATRAKLQELACWAGHSVNEALEQAVNEQYERKFWGAVNAGYAALRADPAAWAQVEAERRLWDNTLMDGLDPSEHWTEAGEVVSPPEQERTP